MTAGYYVLPVATVAGCTLQLAANCRGWNC